MGTMRPGKREGTWELRVEIARHPVTKKRRWRSRTIIGSERTASRELARFTVEVGGLDLVDMEGGSVEHLFNRWIEHLEVRGRTRGTLYSYRRRWLLVSETLGSMPVDAVTPSRIDALYDRLSRDGVPTGSMAKVHSTLRAMFSQAVRWRMIDRNPVKDATPPSHYRPDAVAPDVEVVRALIAAAAPNDLALAVAIRVSATLATRKGETLALRWCDIGSDTIRVAASMTEVPDGRGAERKSTKTHASADLPVDAGTLRMLADLQLESKRAALAAGVPWNSDGFVFTGDPTGSRPWSLDHFSKRFQRLRSTVPGAEQVRLKDLRTYVATSLVDADTDIRTAQARLRHRSPQTTQGHYLARRKPAEERAAQTLGAALDG
jgi:integrase